MRSLIVALALAPTFAAATDGLRCGQDLIRLGENKAAALQKCGEPVSKEAFCKPLLPGAAASTCEQVDEWTFNPGYGQFMTTLRFESGRLVKISYGDRVK